MHVDVYRKKLSENKRALTKHVPFGTHKDPRTRKALFDTCSPFELAI